MNAPYVTARDLPKAAPKPRMTEAEFAAAWAAMARAEGHMKAMPKLSRETVAKMKDDTPQESLTARLVAYVLGNNQWFDRQHLAAHFGVTITQIRSAAQIGEYRKGQVAQVDCGVCPQHMAAQIREERKEAVADRNRRIRAMHNDDLKAGVCKKASYARIGKSMRLRPDTVRKIILGHR